MIICDITNIVVTNYFIARFEFEDVRITRRIKYDIFTKM